MTSQSKLPKDITVLVTGASSGIGAALVRELVAHQCTRIVIVARREDRLMDLAQELGPSVDVFVADLTVPEHVDRLIAHVPNVDLLINNAGFGWGEPFSQQVDDVDRLMRMVDLNCKAVVRLTAAYVEGMLRRDRGWVVNVGSIAGLLPIPYMAVYTATKAFVHHFTEALEMELRDTGVRLHILAPGPVDTEFFHVSRPDADDRPLDTLFLDPQRVARECLEMLSSERPLHVPDARMRWGFGLFASLPRAIRRPLSRRLFGRAQQLVGRTR